MNWKNHEQHLHVIPCASCFSLMEAVSPTTLNKYEESTSTDDDKFQPVVTKRELYGWYAYAVASEPWSAVTISLFLPLVLVTLASEAGFKGDRKSPCNMSDSAECLIKIGSL